MSARVVGRDAELAVLSDAIATIGRGSRTVLVEGGPGAGVSTVLRAAGEIARLAGAGVFAVTGIESECRLPFAALHRLLRPLLAGLPALSPDQQDELGRAFGLRSGPAPAPQQVAAAAVRLLEAATAGWPVVIVVDNLQWLDPGSAAVLDGLAHRSSAAPILLIGGARTGHLPGGPAAARLTLGGLDDAAARDLLAQQNVRLDDDGQDWVLAAAAGCPLALVELVAVAPSRDDLRWLGLFPPVLGPRLAHAFVGRLPDLPPDTRDALLVAAVGRTAALSEVLAALTRWGRETIEEFVFEPAQAQHLLSIQDGRIWFSHPLLPTLIAQRESVVRRQLAHASWAQTLPAGSERRTWHRAGAALGPDDDLADEWERAGERYVQEGRIPSGIVALEQSAARAGSTAVRVRRQLMAAELATATGRRGLADRLVAQAELTGIAGVNRIRLELLRQSLMSSTSGDPTRISRLGDLVDAAAAAGDRDLSLKALVAVAQYCYWAPSSAPDSARVARAAAAALRGGPDARVVAALAMAEPLRRGSEVLSILDAVDLAAVGDPLALRLLGLAAHAVGDEVRAAELSGRASTMLRARGLVGALGHALGVRSVACLDLGDWTDVAEDSTTGSALATEAGQLIGGAAATVTQAGLLAARGATSAALDLVTEVEHHPLLRALPNFLCRSQIVRGIAWISAGRPDDACRALEKIFDPEDPSHHEREQIGGLMYLAEAAAGCGRREGAIRILTDMEALATTTRSPLLLAHLLYARPVLADDEDAELLYLDALGRDLSAWPWIRARILLAYGCWLRRHRRATVSRRPLREALVTFDRLGARAWADQARGELQATGEPRPDAEHRPLAGLSAQELQIARLVAQGLSNAEIGQRLLLSRRTVGSHLYRIFPKLGITSRAQIAALLTDPNPGAAAARADR